MAQSLLDMDLKQLDEMNGKARRLCALMKKGIVQFIFKKKTNGKIRKARGTLKKDLIPIESQRKSGRPKNRPDDLVIYYDVDKKAIRSFKDYLLQKVYKNSIVNPNKKTGASEVKSNKDAKSVGKSKQPSIDKTTHKGQDNKDEKHD